MNCPIMELCKCSPDGTCPFCKVLVVAGLIVIALILGYFLGKRGKK